jgi:UDP-N-acetylmuramate--alanine ligase
MVATILFHGGLDPTMVLGGRLTGTGSNARLGNGEYIVAEADESDGSFLSLSPTISVITNIDLEHLEYYRDIEEIRNAFLQFANIVPFYGSTILCLDDDNIRRILPEIKRRTITYGLTDGADYQARNISYEGLSSRFDLYYRGDFLENISLNVPGIFNIYNAMAAIAVARELDLPIPEIGEGLKTYIGVHRRLEIKGEVNGITVVDDYGHHPTEIRATLTAARQVWNKRIIVVFQPHRYTRTQALFDRFLTAFSDADILVLTDIYPASEREIEGVHSSKLQRAIREHGHKDVIYIPDFDRIVDHLLAITERPDVIITFGAGDIWKVGEEFLRRAVKKTNENIK